MLRSWRFNTGADTDVAALLPAHSDLVLESLRIEPTFVEASVRGRAAAQPCPSCSQRTSRVHSRYERVLRDLPWRGTPVKIRFLARRFFCDNALCARKIFSEQIDELGPRHAQSTPRFDRELIDIGLEAGGAPGARPARRRGTIVSGSTLLRRLRALPLRHAASDSIAIGIDDFAFRRGTRYGTIIVDHVGGRPLDLIDQRESSAVDRWLRDKLGRPVRQAGPFRLLWQRRVERFAAGGSGRRPLASPGQRSGRAGEPAGSNAADDPKGRRTPCVARAGGQPPDRDGTCDDPLPIAVGDAGAHEQGGTTELGSTPQASRPV